MGRQADISTGSGLLVPDLSSGVRSCHPLGTFWNSVGVGIAESARALLKVHMGGPPVILECSLELCESC